MAKSPENSKNAPHLFFVDYFYLRKASFLMAITMTHTYHLTGMTCESCVVKIKSALLQVDGIETITLSKENAQAIITMSHHLPLSVLQKQLLPFHGKYQLTAKDHNEAIAAAKSWITTYLPVLLIFTYIFFTASLVELTANTVDVSRWMRHFMAGFFLTFSFFKLLNLKGFSDSYRMYDIIAKRFPSWSYIYAFIELFLGVAFLINFYPLIINSLTFVVMSISIIGVLKTVLNKRVIQCACLGSIFNLPMSTITIIEDGLMIIMSLGMLLDLLSKG
eukprot:gene212-279_t